MFCRRRALVSCVAVTALTLLPDAARAAVHADGRPPLPVAEIIKVAGRLGRQAAPYLELLQLVDELTTHQGGPAIHTVGRPSFESLHLDARFSFPGVVVEDFVTNSLLFLELPGRRVSVRAQVDCQVHCTLDLGHLRAERDREYPDTILVNLPELEVTATVAPAGPTYQVDYGRLRTHWVDYDRVDGLKHKLCEVAQDWVVREFKKAHLAAYRRELARAIEGELRARHPGLRVYVR
jgi:hypothetical protein